MIIGVYSISQRSRLLIIICLIHVVAKGTLKLYIPTVTTTFVYNNSMVFFYKACSIKLPGNLIQLLNKRCHMWTNFISIILSKLSPLLRLYCCPVAIVVLFAITVVYR